MPARERLTTPAPLTPERLCDIASRWFVEPVVMAAVIFAAEDFEAQTGRTVFILSGWRSEAEQRRLGRQGRPTAPDAVSTHRSCLATGVDVDIGFLPSDLMKVVLGTAAVFRGLRWGGGSPVDPTTGIPSDWNHLDNGPRSS